MSLIPYSWSPVWNPARQAVPSHHPVFPGRSISDSCMVPSCLSILPFLLSHPTGKSQELVSVAHLLPEAGAGAKEASSTLPRKVCAGSCLPEVRVAPFISHRAKSNPSVLYWEQQTTKWHQILIPYKCVVLWIKKAESVLYCEEPINVNNWFWLILNYLPILIQPFLETGEGGVRKQSKQLMVLQRWGRKTSLA